MHIESYLQGGTKINAHRKLIARGHQNKTHIKNYLLIENFLLGRTKRKLFARGDQNKTRMENYLLGGTKINAHRKLFANRKLFARGTKINRT